MVMLVDVHAHMDLKDIADNIDDVLKRAEEAGVKAIITQGLDKESNRKVLQLSEEHELIKPALGIYPPDAAKTEQGDDFQEFNVEEEIKFIRSQSPVAIGEVGMDLSTGHDQAAQTELFKKMIDLAKEKDIPIIVHSRKAELHVIDILEESGYKKVVMHCFCGRKHLIKRAIDLGFYFSIPANINRSEHFQNLVNMVHISKLLTETDSPYLSPFPDKINEPANVIEAIKKIAELKGMTVEDTANNIFMNYQSLF